MKYYCLIILPIDIVYLYVTLYMHLILKLLCFIWYILFLKKCIYTYIWLVSTLSHVLSEVDVNNLENSRWLQNLASFSITLSHQWSMFHPGHHSLRRRWPHQLNAECIHFWHDVSSNAIYHSHSKFLSAAGLAPF